MLDELATQGILNEEDLTLGLLQEPYPSNCCEDGKCNSGESSSLKYGLGCLLISGAQLVAAEKEHKSLKGLHGYQVNLDIHLFISVHLVMNSKYVSMDYNPNKETLTPGQFVVYNPESLEDEDDNVLQTHIKL